MYQNAELMYRGTDLMIDTINAHPEWGVHAQYATPSEYLAKLRSSPGAEFPVKSSGSNFFPYNDWSGYFTSRPTLKGLNTQVRPRRARSCAPLLPGGFKLTCVRAAPAPASTQAHAALNVAEQLFALQSSDLASDVRGELWKRLEDARRNAAIVQQ